MKVLGTVLYVTVRTIKRSLGKTLGGGDIILLGMVPLGTIHIPLVKTLFQLSRFRKILNYQCIFLILTQNGRQKVNFFPILSVRHVGGVEVHVHSSFTWALDGVSFRLNAPAVLLTEQNSRYPLNGTVGPRSRSGL